MLVSFLVFLDGAAVDAPVVAFDTSVGWVDSYAVDAGGAILIRDGQPVLVRQTGKVTVRPRLYT